MVTFGIMITKMSSSGLLHKEFVRVTFRHLVYSRLTQGMSSFSKLKQLFSQESFTAL